MDSVGFSTGAIARGDVGAGVALAAAVSDRVVELSALHEAELPSVESALRELALPFRRVSVHGPVKGRTMPEIELVHRLSKLGRDVVMHPDVFDDVPTWRALGAKLLVENNDSRKAIGGNVASLLAIFEQVPDAGFCLDVSHALDVGGLPLVKELACTFAARLVQLHAGCACGHRLPPTLEHLVVDATALVCETTGRTLPVVLERSVDDAGRSVLDAQLDAFAHL